MDSPKLTQNLNETTDLPILDKNLEQAVFSKTCCVCYCDTEIWSWWLFDWVYINQSKSHCFFKMNSSSPSRNLDEPMNLPILDKDLQLATHTKECCGECYCDNETWLCWLRSVLGFVVIAVFGGMMFYILYD